MYFADISTGLKSSGSGATAGSLLKGAQTSIAAGAEALLMTAGSTRTQPLVSMEGLIAQFNGIYQKAPTRTLYGQLETLYKTIIANYEFQLGSARASALKTKLLAYAQQLRNVEAGLPAQTVAKTQPTKIEYIPGSLAPDVPFPESMETPLFKIGTFQFTAKHALYMGLAAGAVTIMSNLGGGGGKRR